MFSSVSFSTSRQTSISYDIESNPSLNVSTPLLNVKYGDRHSKRASVSTIAKTSSSTSLLLSVLREIQKTRETKIIRRGSTGQETVFQFVNDKKSKLYEWKYRVYHFFNKPDNFWSISYHILVFCLVFTCLIFTVFSTISRFREKSSKVLSILEKIIIVWFCNEFCLRLWSSSCKQRYNGWKGKLRYILLPSHILDLAVILFSIVVLIADTRNGSEVFAVSAFRGFHRLFHVFQVLTLHRHIQPWQLLIDVVKDQMHQLLIIVYIEFISIIILAYISYILEKDAENNQITSLAEAMWWAVITLSTVGYGDKIHVTWWGKLVSSLFTIVGVALFALPAGIIGAGLAIRVEKEESNRLKKKKKLAAIVLIQSMWRCYQLRRHTDFDIDSNQLFVVNEFNDKSVKMFLFLTKFFIAKSNFKKMRNSPDLENACNRYKTSQMAINSRVKQINCFVESVDKSVTTNETKARKHHKNMTNRIENIYSLIDYIENEIKRQNILIDFITFNSVSNAKQLKRLSINTGLKPTDNSLSLKEQPFSKSFNCNLNF